MTVLTVDRETLVDSVIWLDVMGFRTRAFSVLILLGELSASAMNLEFSSVSWERKVWRAVLKWAILFEGVLIPPLGLVIPLC